MDRREFIKKSASKILYIIGGIVLAVPVLSFLTFKKPRSRIVIFSSDRHSDISYSEGVFLVNGATEVYALSAGCTHLGCTLNYDPVSKKFKCPCHGSIFDISGKNIKGPATKDLQMLPVKKSANGDICVSISL